MKTQEGQYLYELVDENGEVIVNDFTSRKTLENCVKIMQRFKPDFHETHKIKRMKIVLDVIENIQPPPKRLCEDCKSPEHIEGSEFCKVSYPEGV
jgi:hypothetical protein